MSPVSDPGLLHAFLDRPSRPAGTFTYHELQGFLFTVVTAPESIPQLDSADNSLRFGVRGALEGTRPSQLPRQPVVPLVTRVLEHSWYLHPVDAAHQ